jgi:hypothetical protein
MLVANFSWRAFKMDKRPTVFRGFAEGVLEASVLRLCGGKNRAE